MLSFISKICFFSQEILTLVSEIIFDFLTYFWLKSQNLNLKVFFSELSKILYLYVALVVFHVIDRPTDFSQLFCIIIVYIIEYCAVRKA